MLSFVYTPPTSIISRTVLRRIGDMVSKRTCIILPCFPNDNTYESPLTNPTPIAATVAHRKIQRETLKPPFRRPRTERFENSVRG